MYFGIALQLILIKKRVKIKELSEKTGITAPALSNILNLKRGAKIETVNKILDNLDLTKKERFDLKKAYSLDRIDSDIANYFLDLEKENEKLKTIYNSIEFLKK